MTLNEILTQVAEGKLSVADAEKLIRQGPPRSQVRRGNPKLIGSIFFILGSAFTLVAIGWGAYSWSFSHDAHEADGTVVRLVESGGRGGQAPVVRYQVAEQTFEIQSGVSTSPPAYSVGEKVKVLYQAERPDQGRLSSFVENWLFPSVFGGFGILFTLIGGVVLSAAERIGR